MSVGNNAGETPLHLALRMGHFVGYLDVACLLIERGADPYKTDKAGITPLKMAKKSGFHGVVQLISSMFQREKRLKV